MDVVKEKMKKNKKNIKNTILLDRMLYDCIIVIRPLWPGVYYIQQSNTSLYLMVYNVQQTILVYIEL